MRGHFLKTTSRLAVAAAAGLFMGGSAYAGGSVGGDCCADLEERVAELEATTARKGNRKVSLTIYGQVNKAVVFFDDDSGDDSPRIIDNGLAHSKFGLKGKAAISADLYAGYRIEFDVITERNEPNGRVFNGPAIGVLNAVGSPGNGPLELRHNEIYIGSKTYGRLSLGQGDLATENIAEIDISGTKIAGGSKNLVGYVANGLTLPNLDGVEAERIRYDSPSIAGFVVSAAWTEEDDFDVALRYAGEYGAFRIAAGIGYQETDVNGVEIVSGSITGLHKPTGLNLTFAGGNLEDETGYEFDYFYVKAGLRKKLLAAGETAFSVDYHTAEDNAGTEADKIGFQLVQNIDAAAMELYLSAWSTDTDGTSNEEDAIMIGSRIQF